MAYFQVTGTNNNKAIINSVTVSKVVDFGTHRSIYQGSDANNFQASDSLAAILAHLNKT